MGHLHALDQCADHLPFPAPIGLCQPVWDLRGKVFQPPHDQTHVGAQSLLLGQLVALRFHMSDPLAEPGDQGLKLLLLNQRLGVTVDQRRQPLPQLAQLCFERGEKRARWGAVECARRSYSCASRFGWASSAQTFCHTARSNRSVRT